MTQYIDKDALVEEIKKRIVDIMDECNKSKHPQFTLYGKINALENLLPFINTLEVKDGIKIGETTIYLNDDGGEAPYDGKQWLDLSCTEYEIPKGKFKDGDKVELIIRKTQKGK
jgi:hypothetical protein